MSLTVGEVQIKGCSSPTEGVAQIKGVCIYVLIQNDLELGDLLDLATMLQDLYTKIQVRNFYLWASK